MLTTREWATLFWLAVLLVFALRSRDFRESLVAVVKSFRGLLVPLLLFGAWVTGVVWVAAQLGLWQTSMLKDTLFWSVPGLALFVASIRAAEVGFFRKQLRDALGFAVLVGFYLNLTTLDVWWEILLQLVLFILVLVTTMADYRKELQPYKRPAEVMLVLIVLLLLIPPTQHFVSDWGTIDAASTTRDFLLPVWLTLGALPFIYGFSLVSTYEQVFMHLGARSPGRRTSWRARLAVVATFHVRLRALDAFNGNETEELATARSFVAAHRAIASQRALIQARATAKKKAADDLVRYAGVAGTDAEGRQLDRREFKETIDSLEMVSVSQMGWFGRDNRYHGDLLERFGSGLLRGLPEDNHGITVKVSRSGQSWFAWRRAPSGRCFAIGAAGPPPDQWYYDGPEPPKGYPGKDASWGDGPFDQGPNWLSPD